MTTPEYKFGTWYPIESAPKDGTEVLLWIPAENTADIGFWGDSHADETTWIEGRDLSPLAATHWMPLPPPPGETLNFSNESGSDAVSLKSDTSLPPQSIEGE
jgi:hypothetical protein